MEGEGHQWRTQPRQDSMIETDLVASASRNHITSSITDTTQNGPSPSTAPQRLPLQLRQRRSNTDTNNGGTRSPMQQQ